MEYCAIEDWIFELQSVYGVQCVALGPYLKLGALEENDGRLSMITISGSGSGNALAIAWYE